MDRLKFVTLGSVDDGKSTLIGRLLYDTGNTPLDQLRAIEAASRRQRGNPGIHSQSVDLTAGLAREDEPPVSINFALFTDGLKAERDQGITIDVAYRYFQVGTRKFVVADCPGHAQYTRNMVTGAADADLALILIDASRWAVSSDAKGQTVDPTRQVLTEQTKRHVIISRLLKIPEWVLCVNKMDRVGYDPEVFSEIVQSLSEFENLVFAGSSWRPRRSVIPISALNGENIVQRSAGLGWYQGPTVYEALQGASPQRSSRDLPLRISVQGVWSVPEEGNSPKGGTVRRLVGGRISSGSVRVGDEIQILPALSPSERRTRIATLTVAGREVDGASAPLSIALELDHASPLDLSRGDMVCGVSASEVNDGPLISDRIAVELCWFSERPLAEYRRLLSRSFANECACRVEQVDYIVDVERPGDSASKLAEPRAGQTQTGPTIRLNDIARVRLKLQRNTVWDLHEAMRETGSLVLVDEVTGQTVGAGVVVGVDRQGEPNS